MEGTNDQQRHRRRGQEKSGGGPVGGNHPVKGPVSLAGGNAECGLRLCKQGQFFRGGSVFPLIAPPDLTIWDAAAVPESQIFTLIGVLIMLPIILAYTAFVYWTFLREGKVVAGAGYH